MSMADELLKLQQLRDSGALTEQEFQTAKQNLLRQQSAPPSNDSLGRAANRYVNFQIVWAVVGLIIMLIFIFGVVLPNFG